MDLVEDMLSLKYAPHERRRSTRAALGFGLPAQVEGLGPVWLIGLSLGGTALDSARRLHAGERYSLLLEYAGVRAHLEIEVYQTVLRELYYSTQGSSKLQFRARARFRDPSVEALNLVYRILKEYWDPWDPLAEQEDPTEGEEELLRSVVNGC